nr:DUF6383 domain-containing protein [Parabacteroides goldsteinii]
MNKKFSTLVAVLLAAGVFSTVDAKVVTISKGATPAAGSSFAIGKALGGSAVALEAVENAAAQPAKAVFANAKGTAFDAAAKWTLEGVQGEEGQYYLVYTATDGVKFYLSATATLTSVKGEAQALVITGATLQKATQAGGDILTVAAEGALSFGAGTDLAYFTAEGVGSGADLSVSAVGETFALREKDSNSGTEAFTQAGKNAFKVTYTPAVAATYELKKGASATIGDDTNDIWTVEAVNAEDANEGFYLKTTEGYIGKTGTPLAVVADKGEAQAFTYTTDGELAAVGTANELKWADLSLANASDELNAIQIGFWQAEADKQPTLPDVDGVKVDATGAVIVDAETKAIGTPIYLKIGDNYLKVNGTAVEETTTAPTAATAEAYSWTMKDGKYTSVALANKEVAACQLVNNIVSRAAADWSLNATGTVFTFAPVGPNDIQLVNAKGIQLGSVSNILSVVRNSATDVVDGQKLVASIDADTYYLLSDGKSGKFVSKPKGEALKVVADKNTDDVLWKVVETSIAGTSYQYQFVNKAGEYLTLDDAVFTNTEDGTKYINGFVLINKAGVAVKSNSGVPSTSTGTAATWGLYEAAPKAYTADELNKFEGAGFSLTIDTEKDKKADIKGAAMFAGKLTAVASGSVYNLKTAAGKYIVLLQDKAEKPTWGKGDLDGKHQYARGYKFATVDKASDIKADVNLGTFRISHASGSDSKDLIVEVMNNDGTSFGRLYIAEVEGDYMLTTTDDKAANDVYPYVVAGSTNGVKIKDLVKGGRFVNIAYVNTKKVTGSNGNLDRFGKVYTVGLKSDNVTKEVGYATLGTEVLAGSPETQWAITGSDGSITFTNREQPTVKAENLLLYTTGTPNVYSVESSAKTVTDANGKSVTFRDTIRLSYVENVNKFDGFMYAKENQLRNQRFNLSAINKVNEVTQEMFWAENTGTHKIGLDGDAENAGAWKLSFDKKDLIVGGVTTKDALIDTVLVISNVSIIKDDKVVSAKDTLAILPYIFQNADNSEYVKYNDNSLEAGDFYICDKNKEEAKATRFALKNRPNGTYHFVTLDMDNTNSDNTKAENYANPFVNKVYAGSSTNLLNNVTNYTVKGNDLMAVTPIDVPEYRKVDMGDTIRIYREENASQVVYEKRDASVLVEGKAPSFLNIDNVNQFKNINPAIYVDTAYVNREGGENTRYQYLLGVNVSEVTDAVCPITPEHNTQAWRDEHNNGKPCPDAVKSHYLKGRFLINLMDTANVYEAKQLHSKNPYIDRNEAGEVLAKLAFVDGYHLNDTLYIQRGNGEYVKLELGTPDFNIAKFAFHYVNYSDGTFKIQTQIKNWKAGDLDEDDAVSNDGYLKWINGTVVVANGKEQGDVFNLNADETRIPTANEGVSASEVSVIAKEGAVVINGAAGKTVVITNVLGQTIANTVISSDMAEISAPAGVVVVAVEGEAAVKAIVK